LLETGYRVFSLTFLTRFVCIGNGSDEWRGQIERRSRLAHRASNDGGATRALSKTIYGAKEGIHVGKRQNRAARTPVTFVDKERTGVRLKMKKGAQVFTCIIQLWGAGGDQTCECSVFAIEKVPCGCLLHTAQKAGKPLSSLLDVSEKGSTFKMQYSDLPPFKIPGNEELADLEAENCLKPPAAFATKAGRPSFKHSKSAIENSTKRSKHAKDSAH
jgi:hypothetical protein